MPESIPVKAVRDTFTSDRTYDVRPTACPKGTFALLADKDLRWPLGKKLRISFDLQTGTKTIEFYDNETSFVEMVKEIVPQWWTNKTDFSLVDNPEDPAARDPNVAKSRPSPILDFEFVDEYKDADIRVTFENDDTNWSVTGTEAKEGKLYKGFENYATMNLY